MKAVFVSVYFRKGVLHIILIKRTCEADAAGENSSFIFTAGVKSVPRYHFQHGYVVLQMAVKEFFETHFYKGRNGPF